MTRFNVLLCFGEIFVAELANICRKTIDKSLWSHSKLELLWDLWQLEKILQYMLLLHQEAAAPLCDPQCSHALRDLEGEDSKTECLMLF